MTFNPNPYNQIVRDLKQMETNLMATATATKMKPFTAGEKNLMVKYGIDGFAFNAPRDRKVTNHFGASADANQFEAELYRKIMLQYMKYENGDASAVRDFDRLKYLMLKVNADLYMALID